MNERIGELLVKENVLSAEQLAKAREESRSKGGRLGAQITAITGKMALVSTNLPLAVGEGAGKVLLGL